MTTKTQLPLVDQREQICRKVARDETLTLDEIAIVADMPRDDYSDEVNRLKRVIKSLPLAGTAADREAARQRHADAEARLAAELPRIAAAIAELRAKQTELERTAKTAAALVDAQDKAVEQLRKNVPSHVAKYHATAKSLLKSQPSSAAMRELQSRIKSIGSIIAIDTASLDGRELAVNHARQHRPDVLVAESRNVVGGVATSYSLDIPAWGRYITELCDELPAVEAEHNELRASYNAAMAEIDRVRDHYLPA